MEKIYFSDYLVYVFFLSEREKLYLIPIMLRAVYLTKINCS